MFTAFAVGGFIGLYLGIIVQASESQGLMTVVFVTFALMLGLALSRITTRFLISRRWVKPRTKRKA